MEPSPSLPPSSNWIIDPSKIATPILVPPTCSASQSNSSSVISAIRPIPLFANSPLHPASINRHSNQSNILSLPSNPPPIRPIHSPQLTTALQHQLLPNSYLHSVYTQQGKSMIIHDNLWNTRIKCIVFYAEIITVCFLISVARAETWFVFYYWTTIIPSSSRIFSSPSTP